MIQVFLNSRDASLQINQNTSDVIFHLPRIDLPKQITELTVGVKSAEIPTSFYNVDNINQLLVYEINSGGIQQFTIPQGNYNVSTLKTVLQNNTGLIFTYQSTTNTYTITHANYEFTLYTTSTCFELLGLSEGQPYTSTDQTITSNTNINLFPIRTLHITSSNFITKNLSSNDTRNACYLCSIQNSVPPNSVIYYQGDLMSQVNSIENLVNTHLRLLDQRGRIVDLNGQHWSCTLVIRYK